MVGKDPVPDYTQAVCSLADLGIGLVLVSVMQQRLVDYLSNPSVDGIESWVGKDFRGIGIEVVVEIFVGIKISHCFTTKEIGSISPSPT